MKIFPALLLFLLTACDDLPKDPDRSLARIQTEKLMKVGILKNKPWASYEKSQAEGIEVALVKEFSKTLNAEPHWQTISYDEAMKALKKGDLDIVIGGLCADTEGKNKIGLTRAYFKEDECDHVMAVRNGENRLLVTLERFLSEKESSIVPLIQETKP
jgi:polar amino acid transport system substrate-binding protein